MRYLYQVALLVSVAFSAAAPPAFAVPKTLGVSDRINTLLPEDGLGPEEVRISNIRVVKDVITTIRRPKSPVRWEPTSISIDISWDGLSATCTCYRPSRSPTARVDTCGAANKNFEFHMENLFHDGSATATIYKKEGFNKIGVFLDLPVNEPDCIKEKLLWRKVGSVFANLICPLRS